MPEITASSQQNPLCDARRPGWESGPAIGINRIPCVLPVAHVGDHANAFGQCWPNEDDTRPALCGHIRSDWRTEGERALYSTPCVRPADHAGQTHRNASGLEWIAELTAPVLSSVLVIGPVDTADELSDIRAYAWDVCDQLGRPAVVATSTEFDVTAYSSVAVYGADPQAGWTSLVLFTEALGTGCHVIEQQNPRDVQRCDACRKALTVDAAGARNECGEYFCGSCSDANRCTWCGENDDLIPYPSADGWVPMCRPCVRGSRREEKRRAYEARELKRHLRAVSAA